MTPKEKAIELVDKMHNVDFDDIYDLPSMQYAHAKQCALIAADEQIELLLNLSPHMAFPEHIKYLQQVKQEIEKL
jgi:hypothetical protein